MLTHVHDQSTHNATPAPSLELAPRPAQLVQVAPPLVEDRDGLSRLEHLGEVDLDVHARRPLAGVGDDLAPRVDDRRAAVQRSVVGTVVPAGGGS